MRQSFKDADFEQLTCLWNDFYGQEYALTPQIVTQNTIDCPVFDWGASSILTSGGQLLGFLAIKHSPSPTLFKGGDKDCSHISALAFNDPLIGIDLLAFAKQILRDRGVYKLLFGQDIDHFLPGCPSKSQMLYNLLVVEGFEFSGHAFDYMLELNQYEPPDIQPLASDATLKHTPPDDCEDLRRFLHQEFPGRWEHDFLNMATGKQGSFGAYSLYLGKTLIGFAQYQAPGCKHPIGGAIWQPYLGKKWVAIGPVGIARDLRGQGYGDFLLASTLQQFKDKGFRRCIVDWAVLDRYYRKHGFRPIHRYELCSLRLQD